jgi:hypothetical protein
LAREVLFSLLSDRGEFMKRSLGILSVAVMSTLTLTGCPGGGGSSNNNTAVGVGQLNAGSCTIQTNSYSCTQTLNGVVINTPVVSYISQQDLCAKINDNYSYTNKDPRGQVVAQEWRQNYFNTTCQGVVQPNNPNQPGMGMKNFTCQLSVKKGNMISEGQPQQLSLSQYYRRAAIPAYAMRVKNNGWFQTSSWVRVANLNVEYSPALAGTTAMDQLKMSVGGIDGDISASVTGFAGGETRIEIQPQDSEDGQTTLIATCSSADAMQRGPVGAMGAYQCVGSETADGRTKQINYVNQLSDVVTTGISISNAVFVQGDQGSGVSFTQATNRYDDSTVTLRSNLSAPTSIAIEKLSYSLKVKCQPK